MLWALALSQTTKTESVFLISTDVVDRLGRPSVRRWICVLGGREDANSEL